MINCIFICLIFAAIKVVGSSAVNSDFLYREKKC